MNMKPCAVIGVGQMGQHHARIYKDIHQLAGVYDVDKKRAQFIADKFDTKAYPSLDALLEDDLLGVSIAVPTEYHHGMALECIHNNLNILIEKPITSTLDEAQELVSLADEYDVQLGVGYIERFNPIFDTLRRLVHQEEFGKLTSVNIKRVGGEPRSATNVVMDLMTHDIDLLSVLFERQPDNVYSHQAFRRGIVNSAQALFVFGDASATCEANWISPVKKRIIQLTGTRGYAEVDLIERTIKGESIRGDLRDIHTNTVFEPLAEELKDFIWLCRGLMHNNRLASGKDALSTLATTLWAAKYV